jgi:hypothetical protein
MRTHPAVGADLLRHFPEHARIVAGADAHSL